MWSRLNTTESWWERNVSSKTTREDPIAAARSCTRGMDPIEDADPTPVRRKKPKKNKRK